jgi:hypothetical protein
LYRKVFTRILYINAEQFSQLDALQQENITRYTEECLNYYKTNSVKIYTELFNKVTEGETNYILCLGSQRKVVSSEQMAAKQGLINLNLDLNF